MRTGARLRDRFVIGEALPPSPGRTRWRARDEHGGAEVEVWTVRADGGPTAWLAAMATARAVPGLRRVLDCGFDEGVGWVAYPAATSGPRVDPARPMPLEHVIGWARAVLSGLEVTHRAGCVHGALCTDDVALVATDIRIGGVGVWSALSPTALVAAWGDDAWQLAPEVRAGAAASAASDVWAMALGATRLALGDLRDPSALIAAAQGHGAALGALCAKALAVDPTARPTTAGFIDGLVAIARAGTLASTAPIPAAPAPTATPAPSPTAATDEVTTIGAPPTAGAAPVAVSARGLVAVSLRPADPVRPASAPAPAPVSDEPVRPRVQLRSIADALPPGFETRPGALGYMAPPVIRGAVPVASARRWPLIVAVAAVVVAVTIALMVGFA